MSWTSRLSKADQAGFRMFKAIMTGAFIGVFAREAYIRLIWVCFNISYVNVCDLNVIVFVCLFVVSWLL